MGGAGREQGNSLRGFSCGPISGPCPSAPPRPLFRKRPEATLHFQLGAFDPQSSGTVAHQDDTYLKEPRPPEECRALCPPNLCATGLALGTGEAAVSTHPCFWGSHAGSLDKQTVPGGSSEAAPAPSASEPFPGPP